MHESIQPNREDKGKASAEVIVTEENYLDAVNDLFYAAEKLAALDEALPFPGLKQKAYATLKQESEEFPEYAVDIDALLKRFTQEGIRVFIEGNDVFVGPVGGETSITDCLPIVLLDGDGEADQRLQKIISISESLKSYFAAQKMKR